MTKNENKKNLNPLNLKMYQTGIEYLQIIDETHKNIDSLNEDDQKQATLHIVLLDKANKSIETNKDSLRTHVIDTLTLLLFVYLNQQDLKQVIVHFAIYKILCAIYDFSISTFQSYIKSGHISIIKNLLQGNK